MGCGMFNVGLPLPRRFRFGGCVAALPLVLLLVIGAGAAPAPRAKAPSRPPATRPARDPAAQMARWFADLGHPEAAVREAARVSLMGVSRKDLPVLERLVRESVPLVPSQAVVLRDIVTQVYLSGEKYESTSGEGFLGVRMDQTNLNFREPPLQDPDPFPFGAPGDPGAVYGVVVVKRIAGFPGARALHDGDVILSVVEHPHVQFRIPDQFSLVVRSAGAGNTIHLQVLRQGQIVRVPVTLDPRPDVPSTMMEALENERRKAADEYWEQTFAPLLKEGVS